MSDDLVHGRLVALTRITFGAELVAAASVGDTVLYVDDVADFDELGGMVLFGGDVYEYDDVDDDTSTITLTTTVTVAGAIGDPVDRWDPDGGGDGTGALDVDYEADVVIDGMSTGSLQVGVDHALIGYLAESIRSGAQESVSMAGEGDDLIIVRVHGKEAVVLLADAAVTAAADAFSKAEEALSATQYAIAISDGRIDTYYQPGPPWANGSTAHDDDLGDLWYDTDSVPQQAYRWLGAANRNWVLISDQSIVKALANAQTAQTTADGKIAHFVQATAPTAEGYGDIWTDTSNDNRRLYWDGDSWEPVPLGTDGIAAEIIGKILTGGTVRTSSTGNRMEMKDDGAGGIIYGWTADSQEVGPGIINPGIYSSGAGRRPMIRFRSPDIGGGTATYTLLGPTHTGASPVSLFDHPIQAPSGILGNITFDPTAGIDTYGLAVDLSGGTIYGVGTLWLTAGGVLQAGSGTIANAHLTGGVDVTGNARLYNALTVDGVTTFNDDVSGFTSIGQIIATSFQTAGSLHAGDVYVDGHPSTANAANAYMNPTTGRLLYSTSTERHKENIRPAVIDVEQALALQESFYESNLEEDDPTQVFVGFIAEQAAELGLDHWVARDEDGNPIGFNYATWPVAQQAILRNIHTRLISLEGASA